MPGAQQIPLPVMQLLIAFFTHRITPRENRLLDKWLCASPEHMQIFERCVAISGRDFIYDARRDQLNTLLPDRASRN